MTTTPPPDGTKSYDTLAQQQTMPFPAFAIPDTPLPDAMDDSETPPSKRTFTRVLPLVLLLALIVAVYFVWNPPISTSSSPGSNITQQNFGAPATTKSKNSQTNTNSTSGSGDIQDYIVGAVKNPGVYTLPTGSRVYQLLQAAGGPLPKANLVALNLAAPLTDGEEIYVTLIGEVPPTYLGGVPGPASGSNATPGSGQLVNINTASADELRLSLHISSTTAQNIVTYRLQHGAYSSVDQLLNVISRSIYDKIKNLVTIG
ncbi:MAG TPA: ComEA family DNA-binding protein [Ktedonobacteraceae bacterium]|nr:ComEA family DNA-binding protein [Ktedonobacteraceae bacterium]